MTVPLPLFNRNQGNIQRARVNVGQSRVEVAEREQVVADEVRQAEREYARDPRRAGRIEGRLRRPPPGCATTPTGSTSRGKRARSST